MADKDTLNLIEFKFGSFQSIKDLSSKEQSSFYFADDKPAFYNAGLWYGVSSLTSSVNEETGEVTLTINGGLGEDWKDSQPVCTFVAGMTTQQKADLEKAVKFVKTFEDPNIDNTKDVIDKWNEIISFLEGFKDTDVLLDRIVTLETNVTNLQNTTITGGDGLTGGGNLLKNRTIALGTPSTITDSSINEAKGTTHTHAIDEASTEQRGIVRLNDSLTSTSIDQALTANQGKVLDGKVKGVADLLNDIFEKVTDNGKTYIKTKYGFASDKFVSAGGTDDTESGGSGGVNLTQMWESLQGNNDTFKDRLINVAHIPTLTTGKISDFVSATQAIANTAVANKADKATTLAGYGITDAVTLNTDQTISGEKTFSKLKVSNTNLVTNLNADMVDGYDSLSLFTSETIIDVNAPNKKAHGSWIAHLASNCSNVPSTCDDGKIVHFSTNKNAGTSFQLASSHYGNTLFFRSGNFTDGDSNYLYGRTWRKIAFTDSDITGNAASATKLKTARKIWGQNFNGTADVIGMMTGVTSIENPIGLSIVSNGLSFTPENAGDLKSALVIGGSIDYGLAIWGHGSGKCYLQVGRTDGINAAYGLILQHLGGNVGVGTNAPTEKLHVQGNIYSSGSVRIDDAKLTYDTGTLTIDKGLKVASTLTAPQGVFSNYIKIGNATISWNPKGYLVIDEGLASYKFISAGGVVTGDAGGGGGGLSLTDMWVSLNGNIDAYGKSKIHIDHIPLDAILSHDDYGNDVADRINTFNYSNSSSFTSAVKALIVANNIPTLEMSKINGLEDTLTDIGTVVQSNYETLNTLITNNHKDHEARIKAIEQALTWQKV